MAFVLLGVIPKTARVRLFSFLLCLVLAQGAHAQDWFGNAPRRNTSIQVAALLPPAQQAFGVEVGIADAGTSGQASFTLGWASSMARSMSGGFFFSIKSNQQVAQDRETPGRLHVTSIIGEDGTVLPLNSEGLCFTSSWQDGGVNPKWAFLRANFEVEAPDTTETGRGIVRTPFPVVNLPLPAAGEQAIDVVLKGNKGTQIRFFQIYRNAETGFLYVRYRVEKRPHGANATFQLRSTSGANAATFWPYDTINAQNEGRLELEKVEPRAQTVHLAGDVVESSTDWRDESKFKRLSFQIPVAPIIEQLKFKTSFKIIGLPEGRIEADRLVQFDKKEHPLVGSFWLVPATGRDLQLDKAITVPDGVRFWSPFTAKFWREDGTPAPPNGAYSDIQGENPSPVKLLQLSGNLVSRPVTRSHPTFRDVPLPTLGETRDFKAGQFQSGGLWLRKVAWIEASRDFPDRAILKLPRTPLLMWVFERRKAAAKFAGLNVGAFDERGLVFEPSNTGYYPESKVVFGEGDLGATKLKGPLFALYFPFDSDKSKTMNLSFVWREFGTVKATPFAVQLPVEKFKPRP